MTRGRVLYAALIVLILSAALPAAAPIDISDAAIERLLAHPFQFDYTTLTSDSALRRLVDAVDLQLATIEYRQLKELISSPQDSLIKQEFGRDLEARYRDILGDGFLFDKLRPWRQTTSDPACRAYIGLITERREALQADPTLLRGAKELAQRIADRLYQFRFAVGGKEYQGADIVGLMESGSDRNLLKALYRLQNDSAAILAADASRLYGLYSRMGEGRGYPTSFDYTLSRLSFRKPEWFKIAEDLTTATEAEYQACLTAVRQDVGDNNLSFFDIDHYLRQGAQLPDEYFSTAAADSAVSKIMAGVGLDSLAQKLVIIKVDSARWPALAIRFLPPYDVQMVKSNLGGFAYYRRLVTEMARTLPWVYADTALPFLLRDYPAGTEEMITGAFEGWALDSAFLAANFSIPQDQLNRFITCNRRLSVFRLRQQLVYFMMEYYLSEGKSAVPATLFWSLEKSLLGVTDSSFQWIETLLTGTMEKYPEWIAHQFTRIKLNEILDKRFGDGYMGDKRTGPFIINAFCRSGRTRTAEEFVTGYDVDRLSVDDIKRQWRLR
ncbi:MAG: hypothetical protein PHR28_13275 [candidate division Zixibacteria bacterium]|nr:hypothetical protein [candidate division Zixibacteria bacterium]